MVLEGAMIVLATFLLTALHPGFVMGRDAWEAADWNAGRVRDEMKAGQSSGTWWRKSRKTVVNEKVGEPDI